MNVTPELLVLIGAGYDLYNVATNVFEHGAEEESYPEFAAWVEAVKAVVG